MQTRVVLKKKASSSRLKLARQREADRAQKRAKIAAKRREEREAIEKLVPKRMKTFEEQPPPEYMAAQVQNVIS
jgi:hypothetical protein